MALEVRPQTVADDGYVVLVNQIAEPVNDLRCKELRLVNDNAVIRFTVIACKECGSHYVKNSGGRCAL